MSWFSEQKARRSMIFYSLVIFVLLLTSCATAPSYRKYVGPLFDPESSAEIEKSFPDMWENRTVHLGTATHGGKPWQLSSPLDLGGGRGGPGGEFPLQITATLMDTMLIKAGLQHYDTMLAMTPNERAEFRHAYFQRYDVGNHLLIWCELRTTWTELYLDLDRWIIFIEDNAVNQYEPVQILEEPQPFRQIVTDRLSEFEPKQRRRRWEGHQKTLMLCFPRRDFYGNLILSKGVRFLKLVFQLNEDEKTRAEGIWVFKK